MTEKNYWKKLFWWKILLGVPFHILLGDDVWGYGKIFQIIHSVATKGF